MRRLCFLFVLLTVCGAGLIGAEGDKTRFVTVSKADAERAIGAFSQQSTSAAMYIWADRYVYRPGESLTLRWTVKPNSDIDPYTLVAYRINNQTGVRTYLPNGDSTPSDAFGNTLEQGFRIVQIPAAEKSVLVGDGGAVVPQAATIPDELGMHTLVVEIRDFTGGRVVKAAYFKIGVVSGTEELTGNIEASRTLNNTRAYILRGVVTVRNNAVLTIEPGTFIFGQTGSQPPSVLLIARTGRINASGTRSRPIIMTSRTPEAPIGSRRRGDWGGILMLGSAPGNVPEAQSFVEGLTQSPDTQWGGSNADHNCGTLRYVRSEFAGVQLAPNNETNGIVWAGCGRQTVAEYLQSHYGNDDAFEWFGGTAGAKHLVATYAEDDNLDFQLGWTGSVQYFVAMQNPADGTGNRGIEGDNSEFDNTATPSSDPTIYNATFIGSGVAGSSESNAPGIYLRRGARATVNNAVVQNWASAGLFIDNAPTQANIDAGTIKMNGVLLWNNNRGSNGASTIAGQVNGPDVTFAEGSRGQGRNFVVANPMMRRPLEWSDPDFRPLLGSPILQPRWICPPDNGFFTQSSCYAGAFGDVDWTEEWTNFHRITDVETAQ
jgi:hypothetical protein